MPCGWARCSTLARADAAPPPEEAHEVPNARTALRTRRAAAPPLTVLWITPMRALAADTLRALQAPLPDLAPDWTSGMRTGDTASGERAAQDRRLPTLLVTTPESVSLLLARADAHERLRHVRLVVVDEWHELVGNKRGVQAQLALTRLSGWNPGLQVWGMSATLGNLQEALDTLLPRPVEGAPAAPPAALVQGRIDKALQVDVMLPTKADRFAWAGHMGLALLPQVVQSIEVCASTLVFTNTRSQAERWYQALLEARPDWAGTIALHHGSLSQDVRAWVENGLKIRRAQGRGVHVQPGPGRGFFARGAGAADRLGQGRGAAGAARGPLGPCAGAHVQHHAGAHAQPGAGGSAPPRATPWRWAASKTGTRRARRSMCWCSTWSPWRWAAASCPMRCWPRCAARRPTPRWPTTTGSGRCSSCARAAPRWPRTRTFTAWCPMKRACGACPMRGWRAATAATSAPS